METDTFTPPTYGVSSIGEQAETVVTDAVPYVLGVLAVFTGWRLIKRAAGRI